MSRTRGYQILDEPRPGAWASIVVQPFWPLLAVMLVGSWLAWPWFAVNAVAVGSPTRKREIGLAALGFVGNVGWLFLAGILLKLEIVPRTAGPYVVLTLIVWKLGVSYWLFVMQNRTFAIYEYYGGPVRNGMVLLAIGYVAGRVLLAPVFHGVPLLDVVFG